MVLEPKINVQLEEELNDRKQKAFIIDCEKCSEATHPILPRNNKCINCFLKIIYTNPNLFKIIFKKWDHEINIDQLRLILDYFKDLNKIQKLWNKINHQRERLCKYNAFNCKLFPNLNDFLLLEKDAYLNPINIYWKIVTLSTSFHSAELFDIVCKKCILRIRVLIKELLGIFSRKKIIQEFLNYQQCNYETKTQEDFYGELFFDSLILSKNPDKIHKDTSIKENIDFYNIENNQVFQVTIIKLFKDPEYEYQVKAWFDSKLDEKYLTYLIKDVSKNIANISSDKPLDLESLIVNYKNKAINYINKKYRISEEFTEKISFLASLHKVKLSKVFPLLIDDYVEEIFLDSPNDYIYLNHQKYGRCRTKLKFNQKEIERLKTLLRLYSGKRLDYSNPSLKYVINNTFFDCRFSIDVFPIQVKGFSLDIRKLNKNILTIQDLLKNDTLNPLMCSFVYFCLIRKTNVTVTGETDSGKTTFINSLDLLLPKEFRKIYVEDVIESLNQALDYRHQLKFQVQSNINQKNGNRSKNEMIKTLLHRTPDIIYLGEILTKEEAKALFHCLAAGLKGFQTIHANDLESLINRLVYHFKIDNSCLNDLDLLILMKKNSFCRRIFTISEVSDDNNKRIADIFRYNPETIQWNLIKPLYETNIIKKIRKFEAIPYDKFIKFIQIYENIFFTLKLGKKLSPRELISLFDMINYYSFRSIASLQTFWDDWKKRDV